MEVAAEARERRPRHGALNALAIVVVSILAAVMVWRASAAGEEATATRARAQQTLLAQQQLTASDDAAVVHAVDVFGRYEQHADLAAALRLQAGGRPGPLARAEAEERVAAALVPLFTRVPPERAKKDGSARYSFAYAIKQQRLHDADLVDLPSPRALAADADHGATRSVRLTGLAALFVVAVVLLTFAELSRGRPSRLFAVGGVGVAAAALVLFFLV